MNTTLDCKLGKKDQIRVVDYKNKVRVIASTYANSDQIVICAYDRAKDDD
jgi:hypothetical protein